MGTGMTTFRAGQRVRIEWPNGSAVEGVLSTETMPNSLSIVVPRAGGERTLWQPAARVGDGRVVTVLSEPRPDEPTGLGAVVEAVLDTDQFRRRRTWVRHYGPEWTDRNSVPARWEHLIDPVVLSEGWTP